MLTKASAESQTGMLDQHRIAVLLPCHNEEAAVAEVVDAFRAALPAATIYVYDNNSTDRTIDIAQAAGAVVRTERHQGKGYVVRRMFADIDADIYVLADGDATYDAPSAPAMIARLIEEKLDMVVGARVHREEAAYRRGHQTGNRLLTGFVTNIFGHSFSDMLSGYRVFSRRFVKSFPVLSGGFEIETELTIHALELELPVAEVNTPYYARPKGSASKLNTWRDGFRILWSIFQIYRSERPLPFFSAIAIALAADLDRTRDPDRHHLHPGRYRSALSDRDSRDRPDAYGIALFRQRGGARYRHARTARGEAARLSALWRAGRSGRRVDDARDRSNQ